MHCKKLAVANCEARPGLNAKNLGYQTRVPCPTVGRILSGAPKFKVVVGCYCGDCPYVGVYLMLYFSR
jgi:hypothetical protein